jgi:hypothetical protein
MPWTMEISQLCRIQLFYTNNAKLTLNTNQQLSTDLCTPCGHGLPRAQSLAPPVVAESAPVTPGAFASCKSPARLCATTAHDNVIGATNRDPAGGHLDEEEPPRALPPLPFEFRSCARLTRTLRPSSSRLQNPKRSNCTQKQMLSPVHALLCVISVSLICKRHEAEAAT